MSKPAIIILMLSVALTAMAFVHDYMYDTPSQPYTIAQYAAEILVVGTLYTGVLFSLFYGLYRLIRK
jgi:hypothetical protein